MDERIFTNEYCLQMINETKEEKKSKDNLVVISPSDFLCNIIFSFESSRHLRFEKNRMTALASTNPMIHIVDYTVSSEATISHKKRKEKK